MMPEVSSATVVPVANPAVPRRAGAYATLDMWRGIASLAVVFFHWGELALRRWPQLEGGFWYSGAAHGHLGVQLFFVISGYCIANAGVVNLERQQGLKPFLIARARRIYPTYWAGLFVSIGVLYLGFLLAQRGLIPQNIFTRGNPFEQTASSYLANLTLTTSVFQVPLLLMVAWTLCYEVAFYLVVAVGMALAHTPARLMTVLHAVTLASLAWLIAAPGVCPYPLNLWPQFGFGVLLYDWLAGARSGGAKNREKICWTAAIGVLTLIIIGGRDFTVNYWVTSARMSYSVALGFATLLALLYRKDDWLSRLRIVRVLSVVGVFSYSLYLTHTVTIRLVSQVAQYFSLPIESHIVVLALAVLVAITAAYGFFLLFEKPFLRRGKPSPQSRKPLVSTEVARQAPRDLERAPGARETAV